MKFLNIIVLTSLISVSNTALSQVASTEVIPEPKKNFYQLTEIVKVDSVPGSELLKRAIEWVKQENTRYVKINGITTSTKAECTAVFKVKPKELNPHPDWTGTVTMHVSIECKDGKYRYLINKVIHTSTNGKASGGDVTNAVPDCGSMTMSDIVWKKLKGDATKYANGIMYEIKDAMNKPSSTKKDDW